MARTGHDNPVSITITRTYCWLFRIKSAKNFIIIIENPTHTWASSGGGKKYPGRGTPPGGGRISSGFYPVSRKMANQGTPPPEGLELNSGGNAFERTGTRCLNNIRTTRFKKKTLWGVNGTLCLRQGRGGPASKSPQRVPGHESAVHPPPGPGSACLRTGGAHSGPASVQRTPWCPRPPPHPACAGGGEGGVQAGRPASQPGGV